MTVKFRDPLSAQACVLVSSGLLAFLNPLTMYRKWMGDSSISVGLKLNFSMESKDSGVVELAKKNLATAKTQKGNV